MYRRSEIFSLLIRLSSAFVFFYVGLVTFFLIIEPFRLVVDDLCAKIEDFFYWVLHYLCFRLADDGMVCDWSGTVERTLIVWIMKTEIRILIFWNLGSAKWSGLSEKSLSWRVELEKGLAFSDLAILTLALWLWIMIDYLWILCAYFWGLQEHPVKCIDVVVDFSYDSRTCDWRGHEWKMCFVFLSLNWVQLIRDKKCYWNDWVWKFFKLLLLIELVSFPMQASPDIGCHGGRMLLDDVSRFLVPLFISAPFLLWD